MHDVKYKRTMHFIGRNGYFRQAGLSIMRQEKENCILLEPITSQGVVGRCAMEIPTESLPEVIAFLQSQVQP